MEAVTLMLPETILQRAQNRADALRVSVSEFLAGSLETSVPHSSLDDVPEEMKGEMAAMSWLGNEALQGVANSVMAKASQRRLHDLLDKQGARELTTKEQQALDALMAEYGRNLLRRAHAAALLVQRGQKPVIHPVPDLP